MKLEYISEFFSGGPKNYSYTKIDNKNIENQPKIVVRGVTLNYNTSELVNFEAIRDMILNRDRNYTVTVHNDNKIKRSKLGRVIPIITDRECKKYSVIFQEAAFA